MLHRGHSPQRRRIVVLEPRGDRTKSGNEILDNNRMLGSVFAAGQKLLAGGGVILTLTSSCRAGQGIEADLRSVVSKEEFWTGTYKRSVSGGHCIDVAGWIGGS